MVESNVLNSIKMALCIPTDVTDFDFDITMYSNLAIDTLRQLGVELTEIDADTEWDDMLDDKANRSMIKTYICLKTKSLFDPPSNSTANNAINEQIKELEFRLQVKEVDV